MAARLLQERRSSLRGNVKFMFQPAEEGPGGAEPMIRAGLLKNPKVDAAIALHMWNHLPTGQLGVRSGPVFAAVDEFTIRVRGVGGHGAAPQQTVDPIVAAAHVVTSLQPVISRRTDPFHSAVLTIGRIAGGTRFNIIPDEVILEGTVRSFRKDVRRKLRREIERVAKSVCTAHGAKAIIRYNHLYPATVNDPKMTDLARKASLEVVGARGVVEHDRTMGAEDMSYVLEEVPGCYVMLGSMNKKKGFVNPHHSARFNFDEDALPIGVEFIVRTVERYLA